MVGGSAASNPQAQIGLAGSNNGSNLSIARNIFTYEDRVTLSRGLHQLSFGAWFQQFQSNETLALSQYGQATFTSLQTFLTGVTSTFLYDPAPTEMNWRSLFGAGYAQDVIRLKPKLTLSLGFRGEFSTGWNEAHGRAATYTFSNGVISNQPLVGNNTFTTNNAKFLPEPRVGLAWSPHLDKTVVRAGFGMYNELQDALGYRTDQNAPFNPTYSIAALTVSQLPISPQSAPPANALLVPGGVQPDLKMPTLISYSLRVEQALDKNTSLTIGYVGSHGYHELIGIDANQPVPTICPNSPCPAQYPATFPGALAGAAVPAGSYYIPAGRPKANPTIANTWTWFSIGDSNYNSLQVDLNHRFSHDLSLRGVYTFSKALDDGDSLNATTAGNAPALASNPYDVRADWGPATYDVRNIGVISAVYELPFGKGKAFAKDLSGVANGFVGGWAATSIVTLQSGFPLTPQLSYNPSNNGDTRNPVRPFANPAFHRTCRYRETLAMVQSGCVFATPGQQRVLWKSRQRYIDWPRARDVGLLSAQEHCRWRAPHHSISSGTFQPAEPSQLQHSQFDRLHAYGSFGNGWRNHQHIDDIQAGSIRIEAALVEACCVPHTPAWCATKPEELNWVFARRIARITVCTKKYLIRTSEWLRKTPYFEFVSTKSGSNAHGDRSIL